MIYEIVCFIISGEGFLYKSQGQYILNLPYKQIKEVINGCLYTVDDNSLIRWIDSLNRINYISDHIIKVFNKGLDKIN